MATPSQMKPASRVRKYLSTKTTEIPRYKTRPRVSSIVGITEYTSQLYHVLARMRFQTDALPVLAFD